MPPTRLRNLGIIAHIDAGKTTVTERILYVTGRKHRVGEVHDGEATMDFTDEERRRGITISSAATTLEWRDHSFNLIDTPGHVDFTAEVERSLRVLDGAIAVLCGVAGVQPQTETVWRQANRHAVPRIAFVNKLDRVGAVFDNAVASLRRRLNARPVPVQMPIGREKEFLGVIDLVRLRAYTWGDDAKSIEVGEIPEPLLDEAMRRRQALLDEAADFSDELFATVVEGGEPSADAIIAALRTATLRTAVVPVLCGSAFKEKGIQPLLDAVVDYLPAPQDVPAVVGIHPETGEPETRAADPDAPLAALVFKTVAEQGGDLSFLRVYSGTLVPKKKYWNPRLSRAEPLTRLLRVHAEQRQVIESAEPGQIVAAVGLKQTVTGDTLCDRAHPIAYEAIRFPATVVSMSIEPKASVDRAALLEAVTKLCRDDPTLHHHVDEQTGEMLLSGMGQLHLEVTANKIESDFRVKVRLGKPRVTYQQTITTERTVEAHTGKPGSGGATYAALTVRFEPGDGEEFAFVNSVDEAKLPPKLAAAVQAGLEEAVDSGSRFGFRIVGLRAELLGCEYDEEDVNPAAFHAAASQAVRTALDDNSSLLEPIVRAEIVCAIDSVGAVISDLGARRGIVTDRREESATQTNVDARVPLVEMLDYADHLRSLTQGHGSFTMEPEGYEPAPPELSKQLLL